MTFLFLGLVAYLVFAVGVCAAAFGFGSDVERRVAVGFLIAAATTIFLSVVGGSHWHGPNWGVIAVDGTFLCWLTSEALKSEKFWPLWAAAFQLDAFMAHLPAILIPTLPMRLYAATQPVWAFPLLGALLVGTFRQRKTSR